MDRGDLPKRGVADRVADFQEILAKKDEAWKPVGNASKRLQECLETNEKCLEMPRTWLEILKALFEAPKKGL